MSLGHTVQIASRSDIPFVVRSILIAGTTRVLERITGRWGRATVVPIWQYRLPELFLSPIVAKRLRTGEFDVVSAQDVSAANIARRLPGHLDYLSLVLTVHGDLTNEWVSVGDALRGTTAERRLVEEERQGYLAADRIITVDTRLYHHVRGMIGRQPSPSVQPLFNFVDVDEFYPVPFEEKARLRQDLGYDRDALIIFCPRRLHKKNGVIYAARAMSYLKERLPPERRFHLLFAGDGGEAHAILELRAQHQLEEHVELLGGVPHRLMPRFYQLADVALIPSVPSEGVVEATSISALEAMASGVPVIASDIGGLAELIQDGRTGSLIPPADPGAIVQAIARLQQESSLHGEIAKQAREYVVEHHSHLRAAARFVDLCHAPLEGMADRVA